jgi:probable rRNA maturation factor
MSVLKSREDELADDAEPPQRRIEVEVANEADGLVDLAGLATAVNVTMAHANVRQAKISVAVVDDPAIHELNRRYLQHDYPTDVLSFVLEDDPERLEGEIVLSRDTAAVCAAEAGWPLAHELLLYVVHGALHIAGYRDKSPADAVKMRTAEAAVLDQLGVARSPQDARWQSLGGGSSSPRGDPKNPKLEARSTKQISNRKAQNSKPFD